jgi:charged multivesicular body protein 6
MGASSSKKKAHTAHGGGGTISSVDRSMLDLKNARDRLSKYKAKLELDESKLVSRAKAAKQAGQTSTALGLLKLKKYKQREMESVEGQLLTVLQMCQTIDSNQNQSQVLSAMAQGKDALAKMHATTTVDDVLDLMDQIQEQHELEKEISDILQNVPELSVEDEAAVEAELEALIIAQQQQQQSTTTTEFPTAPTTKPEVLPTVPTTNLLPQAEKKVAVAS